MEPSSQGMVPDIIFKSVDFPAPLLPITVIKSPFFTLRDNPWNSLFSFTVSLLNVLYRF